MHNYIKRRNDFYLPMMEGFYTGNNKTQFFNIM